MTRGQFDNRLVDRLAQGLRPACNTLLPFYRRHPYRGGLWISEIDLRIAVSPEFRFVYNRLPKVANSSLTSALAQAVGLGDSGVPPHRVFRRPSRLGPAASRQSNDWLWFAFVRNPYSRLLSAYLDKVVGQRRQANRLRRQLGTTPNFDGFCRYLDDGGLMDDNHWAPQIDGLLRPPAEYGFIGRFESLDADFSRLYQMLFEGPAPPLGTRGPAPTQAGRQLDRHYTDAAWAIVRRLYARDFEAFDYSTAPPG